MKRRAPAPKIRRQLGGAKLKTTKPMRCADGHEFGLDVDRCGSFYGRIPDSVCCPDPHCRLRVAVRELVTS